MDQYLTRGEFRCRLKSRFSCSTDPSLQGAHSLHEDSDCCSCSSVKTMQLRHLTAGWAAHPSVGTFVSANAQPQRLSRETLRQFVRS